MKNAPVRITSCYPTVIPTYQYPIVESRPFHIQNHTEIGLFYKAL